MANSYHQLYIQTVFAVKYRDALIAKSWRDDLLQVIGNLINETGCKTLLVNGVEDHIHCFIGLIPSVSVSDMMQSAKARSSKWINESGLLKHRFEWQPGFGSFSYSHSHINKVFRYIQNQEFHHRNQKFIEEYINMLAKHGIVYDERYIFKDLV
jgi:REP element-mobilizing transposase RayT